MLRLDNIQIIRYFLAAMSQMGIKNKIYNAENFE